MTEMASRPIRCFEGRAEPHEAFWRWAGYGNTKDTKEAQSSPKDFKDSEDGDADPTMELYGYISEYSWFEDEVTPEMFKKDLYKYGAGGPITIRMNSYGGDVIAASVIGAMLDDYPGKITVQVDGVVASAATVVAIAGDVIRMRESSYFMIHDPSVVFMLAQLNIEELTRLATRLEAVKEGIINSYERKTGLGRLRLSRMMTDETWMDAQKAIDLGFADEMVGGTLPSQESDPLMSKAAIVNALQNYRNVPAGVMAAAGTLPPVDEAEVVDTAMVDQLRAEVKLLK